MAEQQQQYIPRSALDGYANALFAERLDVGTREPSLMVEININRNKPQYSNVRVKVTHHIRGESDHNKNFEIETKPQYVKAALMKLIDFASQPHGSPKKTEVWEIKGRKIANGKMTSEVITKGKLVVGRSDKGPFIAVLHWNSKYPNIPFYPGLMDDNSVAPAAPEDPERLHDYICANAKGWATHVLALLNSEYPRLLNQAYDVLRKQQANGGGGSSGGGSSKSNYTNSNEDEVSHSSGGDNDFNF